MGGARSTYVCGKIYAVLWLDSLKEKGHLEDLDLYWKQILKRILQKWDRRECTNIGLLLTR